MSASITRSRTGCWTCRARKVKCDETRPLCRRCARNNLSCHYGVRLIWQDEPISRTRQGYSTNRRSGRPSKRSVVQAMFLNTTVQDLEFYFQFEQPGRREPDRRSLDLQVRPTRTLSRPTTVHDAESICLSSPLGNSLVGFQTYDYDPALFSYYEAVICCSSTLLDDAHHNPYRHLILPMALTSEGIYHATLAVAAQKLCLVEPKYRVAALSHGQQAMRRLIQILDHGIPNSADTDELFGLALMLCWYEITNSCRPSWTTHLEGICAIVAQCRPSSVLTSARNLRLYRFFTQYCAYHFVFARAIFSFHNDHFRTTLDTAESTHSAVAGSLSLQPGPDTQSDPPSLCNSSLFLLDFMSLDELDDINPVTGFSNRLLLLINEIADLAATEQHPPLPLTDSRSLDRRLTWLQTSVESLQQRVPRAVAVSSNEIATEQFLATAEVNRLGALLFLNVVQLDRLKNRKPTCTPPTNEDAWVDSPETRQTVVDKILNMIVGRLDSMIQTGAMPLWPLFLAGCYATTDEQRMTVLGIFRESEEMKMFGNVRPAREVIETVWRQYDLGVQDDRKRRRSAAEQQPDPAQLVTEAWDPAWKFPWEQAMDLLGGWRLSLT